MENITHLDLSTSRLSGITERVMRSMLKNTKTLNLTNNVLQVLPQAITKSNKTKLWLSNNPYDCYCDMMWMRDWLVKATNVMDKDEIVCTKGKMIGNMYENVNALNETKSKSTKLM